MTPIAPVTFVTVCKGRLAHLKQSLPAAAAQAPCVVVEHACPDGTAAWVSANHPDVRVVRMNAAGRFSVATARNAGAAAVAGEWICFLDADVVPAPGFIEALEPLLRPGQYYRPWPVNEDTWGTAVCARADFERIDGYDEAFGEWGGEDDDLYHRLQASGVRPAQYPGHLLSTIAHDEAMRMRFHSVKDREVSRRLNFAYMRLKRDVHAIVGGEPEIRVRRALFDEVRRVLSGSLSAGSEARISVTLPDGALLPGWAAGRTLVYAFPPCALTPPAIRQASPAGSRAVGRRPPMPFIVGTGRCGSTLLRLMLDSHPALAIPDETHFIPMLARLAGEGADLPRLVEALRGDARWSTSGIGRETLLAGARSRSGAPLEALLRTFYELYAERFGKPRYGDKTPPYVYEMPLIRVLFPEARFVHLIRDGRDVALSMREKAWWGPKTLAETAAWWANTILGARQDAAGASDYLEVRYEDLVTEPETSLRQICAFLALDWDNAMLRYHERAAERLLELKGFTSASGERISTERLRNLHAPTQEPPDASRIGLWRSALTATERNQFELLAGPLLAQLGYETQT
jgi:hypothetical protein